MSSPGVYRLAVPALYRVFVLGMMAAFSAIGIVLIVAALRGAGPPLFVVLVWCAVLGWNWSVLLRIPYEIRFASNEQVLFVALAKTSAILVADMRSIKPVGVGGGFYVLRHNAGTIRLVAQFTGFHEIISRIKATNPSFETLGI